MALISRTFAGIDLPRRGVSCSAPELNPPCQAGQGFRFFRLDGQRFWPLVLTNSLTL